MGLCDRPVESAAPPINELCRDKANSTLLKPSATFTVSDLSLHQQQAILCGFVIFLILTSYPSIHHLYASSRGIDDKYHTYTVLHMLFRLLARFESRIVNTGTSTDLPTISN